MLTYYKQHNVLRFVIHGSVDRNATSGRRHIGCRLLKPPAVPAPSVAVCSNRLLKAVHFVWGHCGEFLLSILAEGLCVKLWNSVTL